MRSHVGMLKGVLAVLADVPGLRLVDSAGLLPGTGPGLPLLQIEHPRCRALVALQGAQILSFQPVGGPRDGEELLWLSPQAHFEPGKPVRGGIPLCLPWFGPHPQRDDFPRHGFGRLLDWQLLAARATAEAMQLSFALETGPATRAWAPIPFHARLDLLLGDQLHLALTFSNPGAGSLPLSWAFHSYLSVADLALARVTGLEGRDYLDNTRQLARHIQKGAIGFGAEVDRVYEGVGGTQHLLPQPGISVSGEGCDTVIVWNPGPGGAALADIGADAVGGFVCVERGAAFADGWLLAPGESRAASMVLSALGAVD